MFGLFKKYPLNYSAHLVMGIFIVAISYFRYQVNMDTAMYLRAGELLLNGSLPYVDFIDINPPLIFYLSTVPVFLARCLGTDISYIALLLTCLLLFISTAVSTALLRRHLQEQSYLPRVFALSIIIFSIWCFFYNFPPNRYRSDVAFCFLFAQREYLLFLALYNRA